MISFSLPKNIKLNIDSGFLIINLLLMLMWYQTYSFTHCLVCLLSSSVAIFIHEYAHLHWARKIGFNTNVINLTFWGGYVNVKGTTNDIPKDSKFDENGAYIMDWRISLAGPLSNLILFLISLIFIYIFNVQYTTYSENKLIWFAYINAFMVLNIIPIIGCDGWHILRYVLAKYNKNVSRTSYIVGIVFLVIALFLWMYL